MHIKKGFGSGILSDSTSHSAYIFGAHEDACVNAVIGMKDEGWHGKGEVWRTEKIQKVWIEAQNRGFLDEYGKEGHEAGGRDWGG